VFKLAQVENIVGLKDSSGDFIAFSRGVYANTEPAFAWIQGEDYLDGPSLLIGAHGIVTGLGNVWIDPYLAMYQASQIGDATGVQQAQQQINALYEIIRSVGGSPIPAIKAGVMCCGRSSAHMKIPGLALREAEIEQVQSVLARLGLV
jgi:4-hydroxy-tetrahydrodipicolinate synthase